MVIVEAVSSGQCDEHCLREVFRQVQTTVMCSLAAEQQFHSWKTVRTLQCG